MSTSHAVWLGIIQGLTEFLPVSSSGHLLLIPHVLGWPADGLTFDVALNTGTFLAALIYFFPKWWSLLVKGLIGRQKKEWTLFWLLVVATIPAAVFGYLGEKTIVNHLRQPVLAAVMLIVFALILWWAETISSQERSMEDLTVKDALLIGCAQVLALVPGVSRSGSTITAGLLVGMTKEEVAEFSFLLLAPISFGAAITQIPDAIHSTDHAALFVGGLAAFLVGLAAIHVLLSLVKKYGFKPYIWYRIVAGVVFLFLVK